MCVKTCVCRKVTWAKKSKANLRLVKRCWYVHLFERMHLVLELLFDIGTHSYFSLFGRLLCFQLWAKNLQWLSNPWPNRKRDWAAQAATCYTLTNLLHLFCFFFVLFGTKAMAFTNNLNIFLLWFVFLFSPSNTMLDLWGQSAFSWVRGLILSVCLPPQPPPQVITNYIPEC